METSEKIYDSDKTKRVNSKGSIKSNEEYYLCGLVDFMKPRIDAARRGEVTDKSVDEIYAAVKRRKFGKQ